MARASTATWAPRPIPVQVPGIATTARLWDHLLGGKDRFAIDQALAARLSTMLPDLGDVARTTRMSFIRN